MTMKSAWSLWLALLAGLLCGLLVLVPQAHWSSSLTAAFPQAQGQWQQQLLSNNTANRQFRLLLTGLPAAELQAIASELMLATGDGASWHWQKPTDAITEMTAFAQHAAGRIASPGAMQQLQQGQFQPLIDAAWLRLVSPLPLPDDIVQHDPLLLAQVHIEQLLQTTGLGAGLQPKDVGYVGSYQQQDFVLMLGQLQFDPFDSSKTQQAMAELTPQFERLQQQHAGLQLIRSGVVFHAAMASSRAQHEMTWYGGFSLLAITLLVLVVFRSLYPLLIVSLLLTTGVLAGLLAVLWYFESPHLIAFVFATTLIGIAVDYAFHGMLAVPHGRAFFRQMLPGLQLSLVSTLIGYLVLFVLPLAILNQVAVFMMVGMSAVYGVVHWLLPVVLPSCQVSAAATSTAQRYLAVWHRLSVRQSRMLLLAVPMLVLVAVVALLRVDDDVRTLNSLDPALLAQEQQLQQMSGMHWDMRFVLVQAQQLDELLLREQQVVALLETWQRQGKLAHWQALSDWVWPVSVQQELQTQLQAAAKHPAVSDYLQQLGIKLVPTPPQPMSLSQLPSTLQLLAIAPDVADAPALVGVIPVHGWQLEHSQLEQLRQIGRVDVYNPVADASERLQGVRVHLQHGVTLAALAILLFLCWHFGWKRAVAIALYLVVCGGAALLPTLLLGQALNLFHIVGLVLVLALTLDYAIFFSSTLAATEVQLAVGLSALTSMFAFGVLICSQTPVIAGFGLTILAGISTALLFAPILRTTRVEEVVP